MRPRYGTRTVARAKPGTNFYYRMAAWPVAFEEGMKEAMRRHLPEGTFSIYGEGHSTGGPFVSMLSQRVSNFAGVVATEHTPFGHVGAMRDNWSGSMGKVSGFERVSTDDAARSDPFNELYIRTWRDLARYAGPEALGQQGPVALMQLPMLMEEILDNWDRGRARPQFKAEYVITHNIAASLTEGAKVSAQRLGMNRDETEALVERYLGYPRELSGPEAPPVPPFLFIITKDSRDHSPEVYKEVILPAFAAMRPAPEDPSDTTRRWGAQLLEGRGGVAAGCRAGRHQALERRHHRRLLRHGPRDLVWCLTTRFTKMRRIFRCRQGAMTCRGRPAVALRGPYHARSRGGFRTRACQETATG